MQIREIESSELDQLLGLYEDLHVSDAPLPARSEVETVWASFRDNKAFKCFGGFISGTLISSCTLVIVPNLTRGCRPYAFIENVVTHARQRGKGYGRAVLHHALGYAWEADCYKVMLMTGRKDEATYAFYESAGFDRHTKQAFIAKPTE